MVLSNLGRKHPICARRAVGVVDKEDMLGLDKECEQWFSDPSQCKCQQDHPCGNGYDWGGHVYSFWVANSLSLLSWTWRRQHWHDWRRRRFLCREISFFILLLGLCTVCSPPRRALGCFKSAGILYSSKVLEIDHHYITAVHIMAHVGPIQVTSGASHGSKQTRRQRKILLLLLATSY